MFYGIAVGVQFIDLNAGNPAVLRVIGEQINEIDVRPNVITGRDDPVNYNP